MALTQSDIALQMIAQLQALDPSVSAEVGTPERKIIDTVAQALAEAQIDLTIFQGAFDLDSKVGTDLERFLGLFGFARQAPSFATGVLQFSRTTAATADIRIPTGTQVAAGVDPTNFGDRVVFATTNEAVIPLGGTTVTTPVRAIIGGTQGNVAANTVTAFVGAPTLGVTSVTNPAPTTGGTDTESDDELKVRFKNTVFRNLAGTVDQYLALALATTFTTKANVVGPLSRYLEYIQIPSFDDATPYDINGDGIAESSIGNANEWTTALSTIPYSKHIYDTLPVFVSNGQTGATQFFYTEDLDFQFNVDPIDKNRGDAFRLASIAVGPDPLASPFQPNVTFLHVNSVLTVATDVVIPNQVVLFEHSYMSDASRNDYERNILNCVDVFIDGGNDTPASVVTPLPTTTLQFNTVPTNRYYYQNFRRIGEPEHRAVVGNVITPLMFQPVTDIPDSFTLSNNTYLKGEHYWAIEDVTIGTRGTVRARNGIEWDNDLPGKLLADPNDGPYSGVNILANTATSMEIASYLYDRSVADLQVTLEGARQTTTDVLAHKAHLRYFKFDLTVMYTPGSNVDNVDDQIAENLKSFFAAQYFGTTIQLSDILQVVHDTPGIDNVRWSRDVESDLDSITETDIYGNHRSGIIIDRLQSGVAGVTSEVQQYYMTGSPSGTYILTLLNTPVTFNATDSASTIQTALQAAWGAAVTVTGLGTPSSPFILTWPTASGPQPMITATVHFEGGDFAFNTDFFLKDNELPALPTFALTTDTAPGLILRSRAQNTWRRGGT